MNEEVNMSEFLNIVGAVAAAATAIGVDIAAVHFRMAKQQSITTFEDQVAGQYRENARRLPVGALLGRRSASRRSMTPCRTSTTILTFSHEQAYLYARAYQ